jgi:hypothetical protein
MQRLKFFHRTLRQSERSQRSLHSQRGQSMVEMALTMTIIMIILSAVIDLGRGFFTYIAIYNAAAEGALYAAINPWCRAAGPGCEDPNNVIYRAQNESPPGGLIDNTRLTVTVSCIDGATCGPAAIIEGEPITVTVGYRMNMIGPFSPTFPNGEVPFMAHAVQKILDQ